MTTETIQLNKTKHKFMFFGLGLLRKALSGRALSFFTICCWWDGFYYSQKGKCTYL